jgi:uncharacterized protein
MSESPIALEFMETGRCESCPVIDCHGHYGAYQGIYFPNVTAEAMIGTMDRAGVRLLVSSGHMALVDSDRGNAEMREVIAGSGGRIRGWWAVHPRYPDRTARDLAAFEAESGFLGFKFLSDYHQYPLTGPAYAPALEYAAGRGLPILMHTWGGSGFDSPQHVAEVAARYPTVPLLMGHSGYGDWDGAIAVAREHANVYLELTAAYAVRGAIERMVEAGLSARILFGTDLPWFDPHYPIGCIVFARISDDDRHNILHRNAERLLGLERA